MNLPFSTRAAGKLLLTGEYFILDGAIGLATPVKLGQRLEAMESYNVGRVQNPAYVTDVSNKLHWQSYTDKDECWFDAVFSLPDLAILSANDEKTALTLQAIVKSCQKQNSEFLTKKTAISVKTYNEFPREWGLGTSSTLIAMLAKWAEVNPYLVLEETMGGSGYDLACAYSEKAILYQRNGTQPNIDFLDFQPKFKHNLFFVFLGKKQNSREGIIRYQEKAKNDPKLAAKINKLTQQFVEAKTLVSLEKIMIKHENLIAKALDLPRAKDLYFPDYWGEVKSLGAWGGDFVMITNDRSKEELLAYFNKKGFEVVLTWRWLIG
jgi:mevalonate kinase